MRLQDLHGAAARMTEGRCAWADVEAAIDAAMESGDLVRGEDGRITTQEMLAIERETDARLEAGRGEHRSVMTGRQFDAALAKFEASKGFELSGEQRSAARMILTQPDRFQGIQGLAGTGKTTLLSFVREAAEAQGWHVVGHSSGAEQAATMQKESSIASTTTAAWLLESKQAPDAAHDQKILCIMDEAGQSGAVQFRDTLTTTEKLGGRAVMLGDRFQHQSVEAGRAFARSQAHMPVATLGASSIRRQRTEHTQAAVARVLSGDHAGAVRGLRTIEARRAQDALPETATREQRREAARADNATVIARVASDYAAMPRAERDRAMIITSTNADRQAINQAVREGLRLRGDLGEGVACVTLRKADLSAVELKRASSFDVGQVVEIRENYKRERLGKNTLWTITGTHGDRLLLRNAGGDTRAADPAHIKMQAYTREARDFAPGDRVRWTENHRAERIDRPEENGLRVRNGATATVVSVAADGDRVTLRTDAGEEIQLATDGGQKLDHAYAATSYSAQGATVDSVLIHHNTEAGAHGDRETYVSITRARDDVVLYTQDASRAAAQSGLTLDKTAAHDVAGPEWSPESPPDQAPDRTPDRSPQQHAPSLD